jgi:hypothetical protein
VKRKDIEHYHEGRVIIEAEVLNSRNYSSLAAILINSTEQCFDCGSHHLCADGAMMSGISDDDIPDAVWTTALIQTSVGENLLARSIPSDWEFAGFCGASVLG